MLNPYNALYHLTLGINSLRRWFKWFNDVVAPYVFIIINNTKDFK